MARSLTQIYQAVIDEKNNQPTLTGLEPTVDSLTTFLSDVGNSPSSVAVWRLWAFVYAVCSWTLETLWDTFMAQVVTTIANQVPGTILWYQNIGFQFQYGDPLVYVNNVWTYATINTAKQIVNLCAAIEQNGGILIKAAILSGGTITPLSSAQLVAFNAYYQKKKYAGPPITCISYAADLLQLPFTVYYDPLADPAVVQTNVEAAVNNYIATISGAVNPALFNGIFDVNAFNAAILAVTQVQDTKMGNLQATYGSLPYSPINVKYQTNAGYATVDPAYPLSATITYLPNV